MNRPGPWNPGHSRPSPGSDPISVHLKAYLTFPAFGVLIKS